MHGFGIIIDDLFSAKNNNKSIVKSKSAPSADKEDQNYYNRQHLIRFTNEDKEKVFPVLFNFFAFNLFRLLRVLMSI